MRRAAAKGNRRDIELLLEYGANIDAVDENPESQRTALHWAVMRNHYDVVELLVRRGVTINMQDANGKTAVDYNPDMFNTADIRSAQNMNYQH